EDRHRILRRDRPLPGRTGHHLPPDDGRNSGGRRGARRRPSGPARDFRPDPAGLIHAGAGLIFFFQPQPGQRLRSGGRTLVQVRRPGWNRVCIVSRRLPRKTFPGGEIRGTIGSIRGGNVRRISALVLPALLYAALPAAAQTSLAPQISGNSVTAKIQLPGGVEADLSIAFEQVVGLNSNALAL